MFSSYLLSQVRSITSCVSIRARGVGSKRLLGGAGTCWHMPVAHQQSNTDQQMSFRNR